MHLGAVAAHLLGGEVHGELEQRPSRARALEAYNSALRDVAEGRPSAAGIQFAATLEQLSGVLGGGVGAATQRREGALRLIAAFFADGRTVTKDDEALAEDVLMYGLRSATETVDVNVRKLLPWRRRP
ncbi:MAG: hypothetical protein ABIQ18_09455 [Umezawaea sp.]